MDSIKNLSMDELLYKVGDLEMNRAAHGMEMTKLRKQLKTLEPSSDKYIDNLKSIDDISKKVKELNKEKIECLRLYFTKKE